MDTIVFVELRDGRPFSVLSEDRRGGYDVWDFDYCRRDQTLYYDMSGGWDDGAGPWSVEPGAQYWLAAGCSLQVKGGVRVPALPPPYAPETLWDAATGDDTVCCETCDDWLPYGSPCAHLWWCDRHNCWGPECECEPEEE